MAIKPDSNFKRIDSKRDYIFSDKNITLEWDALTFYEDCDLEFLFSENEVVLHRDEIPLDKNITIKFDVSNSNINKEKAFVALVKGNEMVYFNTWKKDDQFSIRTKSLGTYKLIEDFDAPIIHSVKFEENNNFTLNDVLVFEVEDTLSGIKEINGFINDQWVLFEYEYKTKQIIHNLKDGIAQKGLNKVTVNVSDHVGNNVTFESNFQLN